MDFTLATLASATSGNTYLEDASTTILSVLVSPMRRSRRRLALSKPFSFTAPEDEQSNEYDCHSFFHRDSLKVSNQHHKQQSEASDDDTASTVTVTSVDEDDDTLSLSSCRRVSFATPLVTSVHYRPITAEDDKYYLHYNEVDYIDFKLDALTNGKSPLVRRTPRKVGFARDVVTSTHAVMGMEERQTLELYYNEDELQRFLDNFVESLQTQHQFR